MAQQTIDLGTTPNDGTGDDARTAGDKINDNFTEVYTAVASKAPTASPTFTGTVTTPAAILSSETASRIALIDGSKNIKSGDTTTYPSLTEIAYVKGVTSALQTQIDAKADQAITIRTETASHTLDSTDLTTVSVGGELVIHMNVASSNNLTIPLNATVAFPLGKVIGIRQVGAGQVTVVATGGVTLNAPLNAYKSAAQFSIMFLEKTGTDTWYLNGETVL